MRFLFEGRFGGGTKAASVRRTADSQLSPSVLWVVFFFVSLLFSLPAATGEAGGSSSAGHGFPELPPGFHQLADAGRAEPEHRAPGQPHPRRRAGPDRRAQGTGTASTQRLPGMEGTRVAPLGARRHVPLQTGEHLCRPQVFANEVNAHRDRIIELDQTGNQLKFLSQKQDVVLIKNLLVSVQSRWEKVVQRSVERGRALDDARKRAKQVRNMGRVRQSPRCGQPWRAGGPENRKGLGDTTSVTFQTLLLFLCSSTKLGRNWLIGWRMQRITWTPSWRFPTIPTKLSSSFPNTR